MKYLKRFNESNEIDRDDLDNLINPIRDDIRDMLVDFVGYWGPFSNYPMCSSIHYRIEMIDRNIFGDVYESLSDGLSDETSKALYRQVDVDFRDDIKDIFLDLEDDGYDVRFRWEPLFSEDKISSGNYPFVMVSKYNRLSVTGLTMFSSDLLYDYIPRLESLLDGEYSVHLEVMKMDGSGYYLGKLDKVYNSIVYRILMVRQ